jgi:hypothetical protein
MGRARVSEQDWRLAGKHDDWLRGAIFVWRSFQPRRAVMWSPDSGDAEQSKWDHEHCYFCWAAFSEAEGDLQAGWATEPPRAGRRAEEGSRIAQAIHARVQEPVEPGYEWVCPDCFKDFQERFAWREEDENPPSAGTDS